MKRLLDYIGLVWAVNFWPVGPRIALRTAVRGYGWRIRPSGGQRWSGSFWDVPGLKALSFEAPEFGGWNNHLVIMDAVERQGRDLAAWIENQK